MALFVFRESPALSLIHKCFNYLLLCFVGHCGLKHFGKLANSSGVLIPDVSGNLALQGRLPAL
jgi:hypothetical protein